ncbi:MAG: hypothetical protein IJN74_05550 [Clostridia bacterium]|nr:hypothetical protein [Clostridia bacterium]
MDVNRIKKPLYIAVLALLIIFLLVWYFLGGKPSVLGVFKNGEYGDRVKLDSSFTYASAKYSGGVAVFGKDSVFGITNSGKKAWQIPFTVSDPILSAGGRFVLAADRGGKRTVLISGGKVKHEAETEGAIITATVNKKGDYAVVMKERGFKGLVKVFSSKGKELFAWHSAEQNILSVALSEDSKQLAVAVVNMKDLSKLTTLLQFDLKDTVPDTLDVGDENLVSTLLYNKGELIAAGDEALYCFKKDGSQKFRIDYSGREIQKFSMYAGGTMAMLFRGADDGSGNTVEFYDGLGRLSGTAKVDGNVSSFDTFGNYAVVSTQNELYVIHKNGRIVSQRTLESSVNRVFLCGSRNRLFLMGGVKAGMYVL